MYALLETLLCDPSLFKVFPREKSMYPSVIFNIHIPIDLIWNYLRPHASVLKGRDILNGGVRILQMGSYRWQNVSQIPAFIPFGFFTVNTV